MMDQLFVGIGIGVIAGIGIMVVLILVYLVLRKNKIIKKVQELDSNNKELNEHKYVFEHYSLDKPRTKIKPKKNVFLHPNENEENDTFFPTADETNISTLTSYDRYSENSFLHPDDGLGKMDKGVQ